MSHPEKITPVQNPKIGLGPTSKINRKAAPNATGRYSGKLLLSTMI